MLSPEPDGGYEATQFSRRSGWYGTDVAAEHDAANFRYGNAYGVARSADVVYIQITVFSTRTAEQKKALFRRIAELLGETPGIRPEDVFVTVLDAAKENWSVGHGVAQFA